MTCDCDSAPNLEVLIHQQTLHIVNTPLIALRSFPSSFVRGREESFFKAISPICPAKISQKTRKAINIWRTNTIPSVTWFDSEAIRWRGWSLIFRFTGAFRFLCLKKRDSVGVALGRKFTWNSQLRTQQLDHSIAPSPFALH